MFGEKVDYWILRPFVHRNRIKTEDDQKAHSAQELPLELGQVFNAAEKMLNYYLKGKVPNSKDFRYLDLGCGTGALTIALAKLGCGHVTGLDFVERNIKRAKRYEEQHNVGTSVEFICQNVHDWNPCTKYNVVFSFSAFEHFDKPQLVLKKFQDIVKPNGIIAMVFRPLFQSPFGDHMWDFFRVQIPWRGVSFSEKAILRLRREFYRLADYAASYKEIVGGLNQMRYSEFLNDIEKNGWKTLFIDVNSPLKIISILYNLPHHLAKIPLVRDCFASNIYAILQR